MSPFHQFLIACFALLLALPLYARDGIRIEISGVGARQIPVAIATFAVEVPLSQKPSSIIRANLERSGMFSIISTAETSTDPDSVNFNLWRHTGAEALAIGQVKSMTGGRYEVHYTLFDIIRQEQISTLTIPATENTLRLSAHRISDDIYEKLTGIKGIFATRIAYVTKTGKEYRLEISDADGYNRHIALRSNEPVISPAWSPDGTKIAYVSFEARKPVVYVQNLVTRQRSIIANYRGSNSAPSWSPDGSKLALALSRDRTTQVYVINADGTGLRQLTRGSSISTEPQFSPDGEYIYLTSDISGSPQIYQLGVNGGDPRRITFTGNYNISPRLSPDGQHMAFITRRDGRFQLYLMDLTTGQERQLSDSSKVESPSFSPSGQFVMYATEEGRRDTLSAVSTDGHIRQKISVPASDIREPSWGPFIPE